MAKLSTKNASLNTGNDYVKSMIEPGNHDLFIRSVYLRPEKDLRFGEKLIFICETPPVTTAGFKPLQKSKDDPSQGFYTGQVGFISYGRYGFKDATLNNGSTISRDEEIFKAIGLTCRYLGIVSWWDAQHEKYEKVEDLLNAFIKEQPWKDILFHACVGGRQWLKDKYVNYELLFHKPSRELGDPFGVNKEKVMKFFFHEHVETLKGATQQATKQEETAATSTDNNEPAQPNRDVLFGGDKIDPNVFEKDPEIEIFNNVPNSQPSPFTPGNEYHQNSTDKNDKLPWEKEEQESKQKQEAPSKWTL